MDYFEDVKDIDKFIVQNLPTLNAEKIIAYFRDIAIGLGYLHEKGIIHCDIKPGNLIIAPDSPALITDLGYAKHFEKIESDQQKKKTGVTFTRKYAHPKLIERLSSGSDPAASISIIEREELQFSFDLFAFGRTIQDILQQVFSEEQAKGIDDSIFTPYQWRYLALIAVRLLDGQLSNITKDPLDTCVIPGMPHSIMSDLAYTTAYEALEDLEKLVFLYDLEGEIPELNPNLSLYIQIPECRIPLTKRVSRIINHPCFSRLSQVTQLGFVVFLFPGASHSRFEHSLGVFEKCCEIVRSLWYDDINCLFRSIMSHSDIEAVILASLLHDIGQYPMSHDLSEAYAAFSHENSAEHLIFHLDKFVGKSIADIINEDWETTADRVIAIFNANNQSKFKDRILKSIISGPLDADKLDYIIRDSIHTGVTFGRDIDFNRLCETLVRS